MRKRPEVIFFDLYQTIIDVDLSINNPNHELDGWDVFAEALIQYGKKITGAEFKKLYEKKRDNFYYGKNKNIFHHNLFELVSEVLKKDLSLEISEKQINDLIYIYRKTSRGHLNLYPKVFETLSFLSGQYTLAVASHTQDCFTQIELRELDIEKFFSFFIYTSEIGLRKESKEFYERALKIVGKDASDCIMVGDNYDVDVLVPQQLGIRAIWIKNPVTSLRYQLESDPERAVDLENFNKLPELIGVM